MKNTKGMINYDNLTTKDRKMICRIAGRYCELTGADRMTTEMDITAVHCNCRKLDLDMFIDADDANILHDINGFARYLDRENIELTNCFVPRFALK